MNYFKLDKRKLIAGLNNLYCCTYWTKKISHLRTSYDFAHLADLAPVVQKMDNPIHSIAYLILTYWIVIYLLDSAIQRLFNRRLYFIAYIIWLLDIASSVRLLQAVIFTVIFFPIQPKLYWKGKKSTNKECCIAVVAGLLKKTNILNKHFKLDLNGSPVQVFPSPVNPALHAHA